MKELQDEVGRLIGQRTESAIEALVERVEALERRNMDYNQFFLEIKENMEALNGAASLTPTRTSMYITILEAQLMALGKQDLLTTARAMAERACQIVD